jgi:AcrR family transcriptional regulator
MIRSVSQEQRRYQEVELRKQSRSAATDRAAAGNTKKTTRANRKPRTAAVVKPASRSERLEVTSAGILQSALEHFARYGFEGASVRDIAAQTGVNHGMIRHIYGSKEELWREAITFLFERLDSEVNLDAQIQAGLSDRELFVTYVQRYVSYCARHPEHARIMIEQSSRSGPTLAWATRRFIRARHLVSAGFMKRLMLQGALPDVDPWSLAFSLAASCQMFFVLAPEVRSLSGRDVFKAEEVERHAQAVIRIFLRD